MEEKTKEPAAEAKTGILLGSLESTARALGVLEIGKAFENKELPPEFCGDVEKSVRITLKHQYCPLALLTTSFQNTRAIEPKARYNGFSIHYRSAWHVAEKYWMNSATTIWKQ